MVLKSGFNQRVSDTYKIYLEAFPYKIYDTDFAIILDTGYERMQRWVKTMKWNPRNEKDHVLKYFADGGIIWIVDIDGNEKELTKDKLVVGIAEALKVHEREMVDFKKELWSYHMNEYLCDEIIQLGLYGRVIFD